MTITGDARYGDWVERLAYNAIAATIPMSPDGLVFYYSDFSTMGGVKQLHPVGWTCCTGTRPMALADLHDLVTFTALTTSTSTCSLRRPLPGIDLMAGSQSVSAPAFPKPT